MNVNCGLFPPLTEKLAAPEGKRARGAEKAALKKAAISARGLRDLEAWLEAPCAA
jgi:methylenetetrahydrofolate--tRNA-(uracil-5-)-methyltransferase